MVDPQIDSEPTTFVPLSRAKHDATETMQDVIDRSATVKDAEGMEFLSVVPSFWMMPHKRVSVRLKPGRYFVFTSYGSHYFVDSVFSSEHVFDDKRPNWRDMVWRLTDMHNGQVLAYAKTKGDMLDTIDDYERERWLEATQEAEPPEQEQTLGEKVDELNKLLDKDK